MFWYFFDEDHNTLLVFFWGPHHGGGALAWSYCPNIDHNILLSHIACFLEQDFGVSGHEILSPLVILYSYHKLWMLLFIFCFFLVAFEVPNRRNWISTRIIEWINQVSAKWDMDFAELALYHSTPISYDALKQKIVQDCLGVLYCCTPFDTWNWMSLRHCVLLHPSRNRWSI